MNYEFHEAANLFPMMDEESFQSLYRDILKNGLIEPIWLYQEKIIDGRNRYLACKQAGIAPIFRKWDGKGSLVAFVASLNLNRRHLTTSQKAAVALDMLPMLEAEAKERQRAAGKEHGRGQEKVVPETVQAIQPARSVEQAAEIVGIGKTSVQEIKTIAKEAPEKIQEIKEGKTTVGAAMKQIKAAKEVNKPAEYFSRALQFATMAISQLTRIDKEDPQRVAALLEVQTYIQSELGE